MEVKNLGGRHKGHSIILGDDGLPAKCIVATRPSRRDNSVVKAMLAVEQRMDLSLTDEEIETLAEAVPEEVGTPDDVREAAQALNEATADGEGVVVAPLPFCRAQVPSDSQGVTIEFRLCMN